MSKPTVFLRGSNLSKAYKIPDPHRSFRSRKIQALDDVTIEVSSGKTLGIVGESGCGKSTLARMLTCLETPDKGEIIYDGKTFRQSNPEEKRRFRREVQIIFQDPLSSLNPRMKVSEVLNEPFVIHPEYEMSGRVDRRIDDLLERVGLHLHMKGRYPHELSGGERQRVCIARAIALKPRFVICDEAVSSLDVLIQAQILNLILELQNDDDIAFVFISHDLSIVRHLSDDIVVMKQGRVVETGSADSIFLKPKHPYTQSLIQASHIGFK